MKQIQKTKQRQRSVQALADDEGTDVPIEVSKASQCVLNQARATLDQIDLAVRG